MEANSGMASTALTPWMLVLSSTGVVAFQEATLPSAELEEWLLTFSPSSAVEQINHLFHIAMDLVYYHDLAEGWWRLQMCSLAHL